ncbi:MAG: hypothetical protein LBI84_04545 [Propionibacteriaceae bacterium]|nr:hypothetical protein [Propionibacteriaceae bacterium]
MIRALSPPPPSSFTESVLFTSPGGEAELRCVYERDEALYAGGLRFDRVRAYRFLAESHCTLWHVEDEYDTLVEIEQSSWAAELLAAEPDGSRYGWQIRRFLIYVDDSGAYEVAAAGYEWLPETAVA